MSDKVLSPQSNLIGGNDGEPIPTDDVAVSVRNVGKMYYLYDRPQDRLKQAFLWGRKKLYREFWALRGVSFEVKRGETVGIIGQNGSGKSTLLQIIAGTLKPTTGEVRVTGRVAALLELGSGFNPEFTGRENVYMNGAILGLSREEIEVRFDQIAAFADIGEFIDQPVKLYSSGMYVRLAFAVATSVDPDILVVDEAIAVGDIRFQHKCMRRIKQMVEKGVSVLLVSHTTDTVKRFCNRGLWLERGENQYFGEAGVAVEKYLAFLRMGETDSSLLVISEPERAPDSEISQVEMDDTELPEDTELPMVEALDVTRPSFFQRGDWKLRRVGGDGAPAQVTWDPGAVAGFRFEGNRLDLKFLHHPWSSSVRVLVDGRASLVDLYRPNGWHIQTVRFSLGDGHHTVYLLKGPATHAGADQVWWLGGKLGRLDGSMEFKRDPELGRMAGEVGRYGSGKGRLTAVELLDYETEEPVTEVAFGQRVRLRLHAERLQEAGPGLSLSFIIRDRNRIDLFGTSTVAENVHLDPRMTRFTVEFSFQIRLGPGSYSILAAFVECSEDLEKRVPMDQIDIALVFTVAFDVHRPVWYTFYEPVDLRVSS